MEIILLERIESLGQMGDVVRVKDGFARNYLLPQHKALRATDENRKIFETRRAQLEATNLEKRGEAEAVAKKLDGQTIVLIRQAGEAGQLYGSVNARDVAEALTKGGFTVERRQVRLDAPIKTAGLHPVRVDLHPEVAVRITANVARSPDEAEIQTRTGQAVVIGAEERPADEKAAEESMKVLLDAPTAKDEDEDEKIPAAKAEARAAAEPGEAASAKAKKGRRMKEKAKPA